MKRIPLTMICALMMLGLCACATKTKDTKADEEQYVYLPPETGSNLPRKVKLADIKSGKVKPNTQSINGEDFRKGVRPATTKELDMVSPGR